MSMKDEKAAPGTTSLRFFSRLHARGHQSTHGGSDPKGSSIFSIKQSTGAGDHRKPPLFAPAKSRLRQSFKKFAQHHHKPPQSPPKQPISQVLDKRDEDEDGNAVQDPNNNTLASDGAARANSPSDDRASPPSSPQITTWAAACDSRDEEESANNRDLGVMQEDLHTSPAAANNELGAEEESAASEPGARFDLVQGAPDCTDELIVFGVDSAKTTDTIFANTSCSTADRCITGFEIAIVGQLQQRQQPEEKQPSENSNASQQDSSHHSRLRMSTSEESAIRIVESQEENVKIPTSIEQAMARGVAKMKIVGLAKSTISGKIIKIDPSLTTSGICSPDPSMTPVNGDDDKGQAQEGILNIRQEVSSSVAAAISANYQPTVYIEGMAESLSPKTARYPDWMSASVGSTSVGESNRLFDPSNTKQSGCSSIQTSETADTAKIGNDKSAKLQPKSKTRTTHLNVKKKNSVCSPQVSCLVAAPAKLETLRLQTRTGNSGTEFFPKNVKKMPVAPGIPSEDPIVRCFIDDNLDTMAGTATRFVGPSNRVTAESANPQKSTSQTDSDMAKDANDKVEPLQTINDAVSKNNGVGSPSVAAVMVDSSSAAATSNTSVSDWFQKLLMGGVTKKGEEPVPENNQLGQQMESTHQSTTSTGWESILKISDKICDDLCLPTPETRELIVSVPASPASLDHFEFTLLPTTTSAGATKLICEQDQPPGAGGAIKSNEKDIMHQPGQQMERAVSSKSWESILKTCDNTCDEICLPASQARELVDSEPATACMKSMDFTMLAATSAAEKTISDQNQPGAEATDRRNDMDAPRQVEPDEGQSLSLRLPSNKPPLLRRFLLGQQLESMRSLVSTGCESIIKTCDNICDEICLPTPETKDAVESEPATVDAKSLVGFNMLAATSAIEKTDCEQEQPGTGALDMSNAKDGQQTESTKSMDSLRWEFILKICDNICDDICLPTPETRQQAIDSELGTASLNNFGFDMLTATTCAGAKSIFEQDESGGTGAINRSSEKDNLHQLLAPQMESSTPTEIVRMRWGCDEICLPMPEARKLIDARTASLNRFGFNRLAATTISTADEKETDCVVAQQEQSGIGAIDKSNGNNDTLSLIVRARVAENGVISHPQPTTSEEIHYIAWTASSSPNTMDGGISEMHYNAWTAASSSPNTMYDQPANDVQVPPVKDVSVSLSTRRRLLNDKTSTTTMVGCDPIACISLLEKQYGAGTTPGTAASFGTITTNDVIGQCESLVYNNDLCGAEEQWIRLRGSLTFQETPSEMVGGLSMLEEIAATTMATTLSDPSLGG
jgi:hypothetical protein